MSDGIVINRARGFVREKGLFFGEDLLLRGVPQECVDLRERDILLPPVTSPGELLGRDPDVPEPRLLRSAHMREDVGGQVMPAEEERVEDIERHDVGVLDQSFQLVVQHAGGIGRGLQGSIVPDDAERVPRCEKVMQSLTADRRGEWLLLAVLLVPLCVLRLSLDSGSGPYGVDGSYYAQIARNVAEGRGLVTNVCLYHQGLDPLPAPTNIYPLWPVLLGMTARVVGWLEALRHLPRVLYVLALLALYVAARRVSRDEQKIAGPLTVAHLAVVIFGLTPVFFTSTTFPYTEGLAFLLACAALAMAFLRGPWVGLIGGIVAGLATLTRSQMLMLILAVIAARAVEAVRERIWKEFLLTIVGAAVVLLPWIFYVSTLTGTFSWTNLTASYVQTPAIPPYPFAMQSVDSTMVLRLKALWTAFNPWSPNSFFALFGPVVVLVPIAAGHWCYRAFKARPRLSAGVLAFVLSGAFLCFVLALVPMRFFREWLFGWRHGLPMIFLIVPALVELIAFGGRFLRAPR